MAKEISNLVKRIWGIAEFGEGFMTSVSNLYFAVFLTDIARLPLGYVSVILMLTSIADFIIAPLCGGIIDGTAPMRWGKLRSWLLICPPIVLFTGTMQFIVLPNALLNTIVIIFAFIVRITAFNIQVSANYALVPFMAANDKDRALLSSNRMTGSNIGRLIAGYAAPLTLAFFVSKIGDYGYMALTFSFSVMLVIGYLVHFALSKDYETGEVIKQEKRVTIRQMLTALRTNPDLAGLMLSDMTSTLGSFLLPSLVVYFYNHVIREPTLVARHMLLVGIGGMCGAYISRYLGKKFHARTVCLTLYPLISALLFSTRFFAYNPLIFMLINTAMQFCIGMTQPLEGMLYMDIADYSEWKTGVNTTAFIMGLNNVPIKVAVIVKTLSFQPC